MRRPSRSRRPATWPRRRVPMHDSKRGRLRARSRSWRPNIAPRSCCANCTISNTTKSPARWAWISAPSNRVWPVRAPRCARPSRRNPMKPEDSGRFDRALLEDALPAAEPPAGFADRVIGGIDAQPARKPWPMALSAAGGVAATVLLFFALGNHHTLGGAGRVDVGAREEVALGGRGIAVAEEGSAFEWRVGKDGAARIDQ